MYQNIYTYQIGTPQFTHFFSMLVFAKIGVYNVEISLHTETYFPNIKPEQSWMQCESW